MYIVPMKRRVALAPDKGAAAGERIKAEVTSTIACVAEVLHVLLRCCVCF